MNKILFVDDSARSGALNMAIDDIMGRRGFPGDYDFVLRTYSWRNPTLSCGYHQKLDERLSWQGCLHYAVDLALRPTGGRELLHDGDMSFCLVKCRRTVNGDPYNEAKSFFSLTGSIVISGLKALGIDAEMRSRNLKRRKARSAPCLAVLSQFEVVAQGKKIVPMAQRVYPEAIIVHGSIPLRDAAIPMGALLAGGNRQQIDRIIERSSTNVFRITGAQGNPDILKKEMKWAFEAELNASSEILAIPEDFLKKASAESINWEINKNRLTSRRLHVN